MYYTLMGFLWYLMLRWLLVRLRWRPYTYAFLELGFSLSRIELWDRWRIGLSLWASDWQTRLSISNKTYVIKPSCIDYRPQNIQHTRHNVYILIIRQQRIHLRWTLLFCLHERLENNDCRHAKKYNKALKAASSYVYIGSLNCYSC